jgi:hypothetical protein
MDVITIYNFIYRFWVVLTIFNSFLNFQPFIEFLGDFPFNNECTYIYAVKRNFFPMVVAYSLSPPSDRSLLVNKELWESSYTNTAISSYCDTVQIVFEYSTTLCLYKLNLATIISYLLTEQTYYISYLLQSDVLYFLLVSVICEHNWLLLSQRNERFWQLSKKLAFFTVYIN